MKGIRGKSQWNENIWRIKTSFETLLNRMDHGGRGVKNRRQLNYWVNTCVVWMRKLPPGSDVQSLSSKLMTIWEYLSYWKKSVSVEVVLLFQRHASSLVCSLLVVVWIRMSSKHQPERFKHFHGNPLANNSTKCNLVPSLIALPGYKTASSDSITRSPH